MKAAIWLGGSAVQRIAVRADGHNEIEPDPLQWAERGALDWRSFLGVAEQDAPMSATCALMRATPRAHLAGANPALKCRAIFRRSLRDAFRGLRKRIYAP